MKRITFLAAFIVSLVTFGSAKAQVSARIGINIGNPAPVYYAPQRVIVANRAPVYRYPVRSYYRSRPVVVRPGYYSHRPVVVQHRYYGHPGHGHGRGHGRR
ncbi:hypothetical protein ACFQ3S_02925 [Mucilaginibacter terrae]|uniref:hypothetical protein n=1 Tax=Mucilaginibacter terrae TaxID=1955052 RepID=UPI00363CFDF7